MKAEFETKRTELANEFAAAGADLLAYMCTGAALAAIPDTTPQQYVVAGTLEMIGKVLPGGERLLANAGAPAKLAEALQFLKNVASDAVPMLSHDWPKTAELLKGAVADIEAEILGAHAAVGAVEPKLEHDGWLIDGSLIYRLNDEGFNRDEINVAMVNGSRAPDVRHDAAAELLFELTSLAAPALPAQAELPAILFDGKAVYDELVANDPNTHPTSDHVADVLDAVVRLMRKDGATPAQAEQVEAVRPEIVERFVDYSKIAHLIGSILFDGDFKAETFNERELEALLIKTGHRYESHDEISAFRADDLPAEFLRASKEAPAEVPSQGGE